MKRYDIVGADWVIEEHPDGGWVEQEEAAAVIAELETRLEVAVQREVALLHQANADASRIAELERCLKTALEFVPKSVAKRLTVQGGLG